MREQTRQGDGRRRALHAAAGVAIGVMTLGALAPPAASASLGPEPSSRA
ncbi:hypothetical protein [Streptomyces sp. NPDC085665]